MRLTGKRILPIAVLVSTLVMSGCSVLNVFGSGFYDREAIRACEQEVDVEARRACFERLDKARHERSTGQTDEDK